MVRSRANEIRDLVRALGSAAPLESKRATASLALIGTRAVRPLIAALADGSVMKRARAMQLLAMIGDPRARPPILEFLASPSPRLRAAAARCLGRFPSPSTVLALERLLESESRLEGRVAAVEALIDLYTAGEERAVCPLVETLTDPTVPTRVRIAATPLIAALAPARCRGLLDTLGRDPDAEFRRHVADLGAAERRESRDLAIRDLIDKLARRAHLEWSQAGWKLARRGSAIVDPMADALIERGDDPEFCTRAGVVLKALGPSLGRGIVRHLDRVEAPLALQTIVDVVVHFGEKSSIYRLEGLIERLDGSPGDDPYAAIRAQCHLALARIGSRVAIDRLLRTLADTDRRQEPESVAALELVGRREELPLLLDVWTREDAEVRARVAEAVRAIVRRERVRRRDRLFLGLPAEQRRALATILPATPLRRPPRRARGTVRRRPAAG